MLKNLKRLIIGSPLKNEAENSEKLGVLWGLPILSSDAISSVAYAGQEVLLVLIPAIGLLAYRQMTYISSAIVILLFILVLSYRQTIDSYPNGGGAYIVAKDNLGVIAGVIAGASLTIGYILTVAVSISSGVQQITSAFIVLKPYTVLICVLIVLLLTIGNLRGVRESSRLFGVPAYAFIIAIISMMVAGFVKIKCGYVPPQPTIKSVGEPITMLLMLKAFSSGCTALTGIEAVSNAVPNFKKPSVKYAKLVLVLLAIIIFILFEGTSLLANYYKVIPIDKALLIMIAQEVFGRNFMFYFVTATTFVILVMGANTAYSGFPMLVAVMAKEGHVPRQLSMKGDRLSYSNGIITLSAVSVILIIIFRAQVTALIGLYAVGVFITFTLSQFGMFMRWLRHRGKNWHVKAFINGFGALVTSAVVMIIAVIKFSEGAWIVVVLIPILVVIMLKIKRHYTSVASQLRMNEQDIKEINIDKETYKLRVIVPIASVNRSSVRALRYAKTISNHVIAFNVSLDEESGEKIKEKYALLNTDIPLYVKYSPFRKVVEPLLNFIESEEYEYKKGDIITVILPQFTVNRWWHNILHNNTRLFIEKELLKHKHIVVSVMPLHLKDDDIVLNDKNLSRNSARILPH